MTDTPEDLRNADGVVIKSSNDWSLGLNLVILDPDGWDRTNFRASWMELITEEEFSNRLMRSTVQTLADPITSTEPATPSDEPEIIYPDPEPVPVEDADEPPLVPGTENPETTPLPDPGAVNDPEPA